jgi:hypothetical protein
MTTLSQPDSIREPENLSALPRLPGDEGGPVFAEPWQAQAFALAVWLSRQGHFTWIPSAMTGFIVRVFLFRNRVSPEEAFEGLELGEGKPSRPVLRVGMGGHARG